MQTLRVEREALGVGPQRAATELAGSVVGAASATWDLRTGVLSECDASLHGGGPEGLVE